jgi:hypothetical protein
VHGVVGVGGQFMVLSAWVDRVHGVIGVGGQCMELSAWVDS